jgi:hypothetical protein
MGRKECILIGRFIPYIPYIKEKDYTLLEELAKFPRKRSLSGKRHRLGRIVLEEEKSTVERLARKGYLHEGFTETKEGTKPTISITNYGEENYLLERESRRIESSFLWKLFYNIKNEF